MQNSFRWVRVLALSLGMMAILVTSLAAPFARPAAAQSLPADWIKGFVVINYSQDPYAAHNIPAALADLAKTGATHRALAALGGAVIALGGLCRMCSARRGIERRPGPLPGPSRLSARRGEDDEYGRMSEIGEVLADRWLSW